MKYAVPAPPADEPLIDTIRAMREPNCVGALIRDGHNQVYLHRRSLRRNQLPGAWDIVGGHVEQGEAPEDALAREVCEETGWQLRRIEGVVADWEWSHNGVVRRELDYLVEVDGDLNSPRLEPGKHDKFCWVGYKNPDAVRSPYDAGNDVLWNIIKRATRIRLTSDLRLEPATGPALDAFVRLHQDEVAALDRRVLEEHNVPGIAAQLGRQWDTGCGVHWIAYWRGPARPAIGYGGLMRRVVRGSEQLVLQCAVPPGEQQLEAAQEIVKAVLAFACNELHAERVYACIWPTSRWARETMARSGMQHVGVINSAGGHVQLFQISFLNDSIYDLDQDVITGIGQILAVPG